MITDNAVTDSTRWYKITPTDFGNTSRGMAFYDPQPVEVSISLPKKPPVLKLREAKTKEQLKVWGLRKR